LKERSFASVDRVTMALLLRMWRPGRELINQPRDSLV
jgi:hypothetical protein